MALPSQSFSRFYNPPEPPEVPTFTAEATAVAPISPWRRFIRQQGAEQPQQEQPPIEPLPFTMPQGMNVPQPAVSGAVPYMMDPITGRPAMGPEQVAAGIGRRTPRTPRPDPYSIQGTRSYGGNGGGMNGESPYSEAIRGGF